MHILLGNPGVFGSQKGYRGAILEVLLLTCHLHFDVFDYKRKL